MSENGLLVGMPALVVIDMQHDFLDIDPAIITGNPDLIPNIRKLLEAARSAGIAVIHTKECHRPGGVDMGVHELGHPVHCVEGTKGIEIIDELTPIPGKYIILKRKWSAFIGTDLDLLLKNLGVQTLITSGILASYCVFLTSADAIQREYHVRLVEDCVDNKGETASAAIKLMREMTTGSQIVLDEILAALKEHEFNS